MLTLALLLLIALPGLALDLGIHAPAKPMSQQAPPPPDPDVQRQGGDTIADAVTIAVPYSGTGTTEGYADDYDVDCPYTGGIAPDVIYTFTLDEPMTLTLDMYGSAYDTRIWIWDDTFDWPIACNDDFYPDYTSRIERIELEADTQYWIVVDGYNAECGEYVLTVTEYEVCEVDIPAGAQLESEPPLVDGYVDVFNGGCDNPDTPSFLDIGPLFAGVLGWYDDPEGHDARDTDWLRVVNPIGAYSMMVTITAEFPTHLAVMYPHDCNDITVQDIIHVAACMPGHLSFPVVTGQEIWLWVAPTTTHDPYWFDDMEYDYVLEVNLPVAVEQRSWSSIKRLYQ